MVKIFFYLNLTPFQICRHLRSLRTIKNEKLKLKLPVDSSTDHINDHLQKIPTQLKPSQENQNILVKYAHGGLAQQKMTYETGKSHTNDKYLVNESTQNPTGLPILSKISQMPKWLHWTTNMNNSLLSLFSANNNIPIKNIANIFFLQYPQTTISYEQFLRHV